MRCLERSWCQILIYNDQYPKLIQSIPDRYLYWSDWGDTPHIGRIGMDGSNRSAIIEDKITWPNGLTLDFINDRIYWADAREDYIAFASLDGSNRHTGNTHMNSFKVCWCNIKVVVTNLLVFLPLLL